MIQLEVANIILALFGMQVAELNQDGGKENIPLEPRSKLGVDHILLEDDAFEDAQCAQFSSIRPELSSPKPS